MGRFDYYSRDIKQFQSKGIIYSKTGGACVDTVFWKNLSEKGKERQPMKSRAQ
jgi:hypothetical protein